MAQLSDSIFCMAAKNREQGEGKKTPHEEHASYVFVFSSSMFSFLE